MITISIEKHPKVVNVVATVNGSPVYMLSKRNGEWQVACSTCPSGLNENSKNVLHASLICWHVQQEFENGHLADDWSKTFSSQELESMYTLPPWTLH